MCGRLLLSLPRCALLAARQALLAAVAVAGGMMVDVTRVMVPVQ